MLVGRRHSILLLKSYSARYTSPMYTGGKKKTSKSLYLSTPWDTQAPVVHAASCEQNSLIGTLASRALCLGTDDLFFMKTSYDPGYERVIHTLKSAGLQCKHQSNFIFNDYPKIVSLGLEFTVDRGWGEVKTYQTASMLPPSADQNIAFSKLIGETLERFVSIRRPSGHPDSQYTCIADAPFSYTDIPHFSQEQVDTFPFLVSSEAGLLALESVIAINVTQGKTTPLPAQVVFHDPPSVEHHKEHFFQQSTTSGAAGGFSYYSASCAAIYEIIERDNFLLWWSSNTYAPRIDVSGSPYLEQQVQELKDVYSLDVYFFDISYDVPVNTAMCLVIDRTLNIVSIAARAGVAEDICTSALGEALTILSTNRKRIERNVPRKDFSVPFQVLDATLIQSVREVTWCTPEAIAWVDAHIVRTPHTVSYQSFAARYKTFLSTFFEYVWLTKHFSRLSNTYGSSYNLYLYEYAHPILSENAYHVVRAFVPAFIKLYLSEIYATHQSPRLEQYRERRKEYMRHDIINFLPHFFP